MNNNISWKVNYYQILDEIYKILDKDIKVEALSAICNEWETKDITNENKLKINIKKLEKETKILHK